jgi:glycolate oxidase
MGDIVERLADVVGADNVLTGVHLHEDYTHDEALTATPCVPLAVVRPGCTAEVAAIVRLADEHRVPVTARGSAVRRSRRRTGSWCRSSG